MYAYDPQLSIQLAKNHPELFEMRACYNNVYNMVMQHLEELTPWEKLRSFGTVPPLLWAKAFHPTTRH